MDKETEQPQAEGEEMTIYVKGTWKGLEQHKCAFCAFDTLDGEEAIFKHFLAVHAPKPEPAKPVLIPVYDKYGNLVEDIGDIRNG